MLGLSGLILLLSFNMCSLSNYCCIKTVHALLYIKYKYDYDLYITFILTQQVFTILALVQLYPVKFQNRSAR